MEGHCFKHFDFSTLSALLWFSAQVCLHKVKHFSILVFGSLTFAPAPRVVAMADSISLSSTSRVGDEADTKTQSKRQMAKISRTVNLDIFFVWWRLTDRNEVIWLLTWSVTLTTLETLIHHSHKSSTIFVVGLMDLSFNTPFLYKI